MNFKKPFPDKTPTKSTDTDKQKEKRDQERRDMAKKSEEDERLKARQSNPKVAETKNEWQPQAKRTVEDQRRHDAKGSKGKDEETATKNKKAKEIRKSDEDTANKKQNALKRFDKKADDDTVNKQKKVARKSSTDDEDTLNKQQMAAKRSDKKSDEETANKRNALKRSQKKADEEKENLKKQRNAAKKSDKKVDGEMANKPAKVKGTKPEDDKAVQNKQRHEMKKSKGGNDMATKKKKEIRKSSETKAETKDGKEAQKKPVRRKLKKLSLPPIILTKTKRPVAASSPKPAAAVIDAKKPSSADTKSSDTSSSDKEQDVKPAVAKEVDGAKPKPFVQKITIAYPTEKNLRAASRREQIRKQSEEQDAKGLAKPTENTKEGDKREKGESDDKGEPLYQMITICYPKGEADNKKLTVADKAEKSEDQQKIGNNANLNKELRKALAPLFAKTPIYLVMEDLVPTPVAKAPTAAAKKTEDKSSEEEVEYDEKYPTLRPEQMASDEPDYDDKYPTFRPEQMDGYRYQLVMPLDKKPKVEKEKAAISAGACECAVAEPGVKTKTISVQEMVEIIKTQPNVQISIDPTARVTTIKYSPTPMMSADERDTSLKTAQDVFGKSIKVTEETKSADLVKSAKATLTLDKSFKAESKTLDSDKSSGSSSDKTPDSSVAKIPVDEKVDKNKNDAELSGKKKSDEDNSE